MLVRTDLVKSGRYKTFRTSKASRSPRTLPGARGFPPIAKFLERSGLKLDDVKLIYLPYTQHGIALKNGSVDVTQTLEPFATDAVKNGYAVKVAGDDNTIRTSRSPCSCSRPVHARPPDLGLKFMRAFVRGARYYNDALAAAESPGPTPTRW